jgi:FKBP-type peptidyl-prolyl cis-trans isomerase FkpA
MKKHMVPLAMVVLILVSGITACNHEYPGFKKDKTGIYYKFHVRNDDSTKIETGDLITVDFTIRTKDTVILTSRRDIMMPYRFEVLPSRFKGDIYDAFTMMSSGDSATFIIKGDSLFIRDFEILNLPKFIDNTTMVYLDARILNIIPKVEFDRQKAQEEKLHQEELEELRKNEPVLIQNYLDGNKIHVKPTTTGMYFIEKRAGKGPKVEKGKNVTVDYIAKKVNGEIFETSIKDVAIKSNIFDSAMVYEPFKCVMGDGAIIQGLEEGLSYMRQGGKAIFIVPSSLAYGPEGLVDFIGPYTPIVYEVEVLEVK